MTRQTSYMVSGILMMVVSVSASARSALAVTYHYSGPVLSGSSPYGGNPITATVTFRNLDVIPLLGTGGFLAGDSVNGTDDFVESFSFSVGPPTTIDSLNASFSFWQFTFNATLGITQWEANVEAFLGRGSASFPEMIYARNPGDLAGTDDTLANQSDFFVVGPFATASSSGSWTLIQIPEPSTIALTAMAVMAIAMRRARGRRS